VTQSLFVRLEKSLAKGWDRWSLNLEGQDPREFLFDLVRGLKGTGPEGTGKRIENRHRYVGLGPSLAWMLVCRDPSYPVMYDSMEAFARLWDACQPALSGTGYHYVSLGIGTGDKDRHVLDRLTPDQPDLFYVPTDISGHMLRLGAAETQRRMPGRVLPIEMDFEDPSAIDALRALLDDLLGDDPILFSLLGSSLANIDDETGFLKRLTKLMRPRDRLAMELAITHELDAAAAQAAAEERTGSRLYNEFVTAALGMYTDLTIDTNWLRFDGSVEDGHAVRVEGHYVNCSRETLTLMLPNRETIPYRAGESIQVLLGRKFTPEGLRRMFTACHLNELAFEEDFNQTPERNAGRLNTFGLAMMVLQHEPHSAQAVTPLTRVWGSPAQPVRHG
jgi:L-histidine N-alpha-methyltransferase